MKALSLKKEYNKCRLKLAQTCFELGMFGECIRECDLLLALNRGEQKLIKLRRDADVKLV